MSLNRKASSISILSYGEKLLSALRITASGSGLVVTAAHQQKGQWADEDGSLSKALSAFCGQHALARDRVYTIIPRHDVTARIIELPSQDTLEIDNMVRLTAEELVPYPLEELIVSQCVLQNLPGGASRVLVAVVHDTVIHAHLELLRAAGIDPQAIFLSTACLLSAALAAPPKDCDCYALVNLAAGGLDVLVIREGRLEYARGIATQSDWDFEGEGQTGAGEELSVELRNSLSAHKRESVEGTGADHVFLCSDWGPTTGIANTLTTEFSLPVAPASHGLEILSKGRDLLTGIPLVSLGAALTALGRAECVITLTPESVTRQRARATTRVKALRLSAFVALLLVSLAGAFAQDIYARKAYIRELEARVDALRPTVQDVIGKRRHMEQLQRRVERGGTVLELLAAITDLAPMGGMTFTRFSFRHDDGITVVGRSQNLENIDRLADDLRRTAKTSFPQFAQARQMYTNQIRERNRDVIEFSIAIKFPSQEDSE